VWTSANSAREPWLSVDLSPRPLRFTCAHIWQDHNYAASTVLLEGWDGSSWVNAGPHSMKLSGDRTKWRVTTVHPLKPDSRWSVIELKFHRDASCATSFELDPSVVMFASAGLGEEEAAGGSSSQAFDDDLKTSWEAPPCIIDEDQDDSKRCPRWIGVDFGLTSPMDVQCISVWQEGAGLHGNGLLVQRWSGSNWITVWQFGRSIPDSQWVRIPKDIPPDMHMAEMNWAVLGLSIGLTAALLLCLGFAAWLKGRLSEKTWEMPKFVRRMARESYAPTAEQQKQVFGPPKVVVGVAVTPRCAPWSAYRDVSIQKVQVQPQGSSAMEYTKLPPQGKCKNLVYSGCRKVREASMIITGCLLEMLHCTLWHLRLYRKPGIDFSSEPSEPASEPEPRVRPKERMKKARGAALAALKDCWKGLFKFGSLVSETLRECCCRRPAPPVPPAPLPPPDLEQYHVERTDVVPFQQDAVP